MKTVDPTSKRRPALADVAREAGVGTTTVSRVINGGHYVGKDTMAHVKGVMARLGYQPNQAARALKGEKTNTLGLIIPSMRDAFFASLADTIHKMAHENNYVLIVLTSDDDAAQEIAQLNVFHRHRIDGLLLVPPRVQGKSFLTSLQRLPVPKVSVDRPIAPGISSVICDNYAAARSATEHLIRHGRRKILCLGGDPDLYTIHERLRGYEDAMKEAGCKPHIVMDVISSNPPQKWFHPFVQNQRKSIDAILSLYNIATMRAYEAAFDSGRRVPEDLAIVGFDDFDLSSTLRPTASVVRQPVDEIGRTSLRLLLDQIRKTSVAPLQVMVGTELVLRQSCGCGR